MDLKAQTGTNQAAGHVTTHPSAAGASAADTPDSGLASTADTPKKPEPLPDHSNATEWNAMEESVVGLAHRERNRPCQDASLARFMAHPFLIVADGAGSSPVSEIGAQAVVTGIARLIQTLHTPLSEYLDTPRSEQRENIPHWAMLLTKHARGILDDLAEQLRRPVRDLRCTLLCAVVGRENLLWLRIGDGELILERTRGLDEQKRPQREMQTLGLASKGEHANETLFLDIAHPENIQWGLEPVYDISGIAAMSDGAAEKLVSYDGARIAPRLGTLFGNLRLGKLRRSELTRMFYTDEFCQRTTGDDRSIALLAREVQLQEPTPQPCKSNEETVIEPPIDKEFSPPPAPSETTNGSKVKETRKNRKIRQNTTTEKPKNGVEL